MIGDFLELHRDELESIGRRCIDARHVRDKLAAETLRRSTDMLYDSPPHLARLVARRRSARPERFIRQGLGPCRQRHSQASEQAKLTPNLHPPVVLTSPSVYGSTQINSGPVLTEWTKVPALKSFASLVPVAGQMALGSAVAPTPPGASVRRSSAKATGRIAQRARRRTEISPAPRRQAIESTHQISFVPHHSKVMWRVGDLRVFAAGFPKN